MIFFKNNIFKKGFTVVELLIVIAIVAILAALMVPQVIKLIDRADDTAAIAGLKELQHESELLLFAGENLVDFSNNPRIIAIKNNIEKTHGVDALILNYDDTHFCAYTSLYSGLHWCVDSRNNAAGWIIDPSNPKNCSNINPSCLPIVIVQEKPSFVVYVIGSGNVYGTAPPNPLRIIDTSATPPDNIEYFAVNDSVILTALPDSGFLFLGWGGECASLGTNPTCNLTITSSVSVSATFSSINSIGWAWSDSIGWISLSSLNHIPPSGPIYGVSLNPVTGDLNGYAWSSEVGWIKFDPVGIPPSTPAHTSSVDLSTGAVSGWARIITFADPNEGWIRFSHSSPFHQTTYNLLSRTFSGWAWSSEIGWISFGH